jgi:hypothetical protein
LWGCHPNHRSLQYHRRLILQAQSLQILRGFFFLLLDAMLLATSALLLFLFQAQAIPVFLDPIASKDGAETIETIGDFKWLVVENDVGSSNGTLDAPSPGCGSNDTGYPQDCDWPSIRTIKAQAAICSSGSSAEWNNATFFNITREGKYMVTVMAENFRICGGYFEVPTDPDPPADSITVTPVCQQFPLPLGTIRMFVFLDNTPCNGQYDPGEQALSDFGIGVNDIEGAITEDYYGNDILQIVSDVDGMIVVPNMW